MKLSELVTEFTATRAPGWLVLDAPQALDCGLSAARFYAGYGDIKSVSLSDVLPGAPGAGGTLPDPPDVDPEVLPALPIKDLALIDGDTELTVGEWAIIRPLFVLYVERENAIRLEASRGLGVDPFGRTASEVQSDITVMETEILPQKAFVHPAVTI